MKTAAYIAVLLLLALSYPYLSAYYNDSNQSSEEAADPSVLLPIEARLVEHEPRIIQAHLLEERPDRIRVSVEYTVPTTSPEGRYSLSIHPDMGHWSYSHAEVVKGGRQNAEMTISFRPQEEGLREVDSTKLMFYFGRSQDNRFIGTMGKREAPFPKTWRAVP